MSVVLLQEADVSPELHGEFVTSMLLLSNQRTIQSFIMNEVG
jgi:hypothetical protein